MELIICFLFKEIISKDFSPPTTILSSSILHNPFQQPQKAFSKWHKNTIFFPYVYIFHNFVASYPPLIKIFLSSNNNNELIVSECVNVVNSWYSSLINSHILIFSSLEHEIILSFEQ